MLEQKKFFSNFSDLCERLKKRNIEPERLLLIRDLLQNKKKLLNELNKLKKERNRLSKNKEQSQLKINELVRNIRCSISQKTTELNQLTKKLNNLIDNLPNLPAINTPGDKEGNKVIDTTWYEHHINNNQNLTYQEIIKKLSLIDEKKSALLSGSRFAVYQDTGSKLLHALINFLLVKNNQKGYKIYDTPYLVYNYNLYNTGQLPKFAEDLYKLENYNYYLIPTAEVSLIGLYQKQIIKQKELPIKICGYSPCFRAEAGAAGKENKSLIRLHQFHKVELIKIVNPVSSYKELEEMVTDARDILHSLKISHQVIDLCYSELGFSAAKTYDINVWLPISKKWLEISSCSNCEDFQARRAQIRVKNENTITKYLPHTLNGSSLAIDRLILTLCEYYYDEKENRLKLPANLEKFFF